jgi:hypothetical protein
MWGRRGKRSRLGPLWRGGWPMPDDAAAFAGRGANRRGWLLARAAFRSLRVRDALHHLSLSPCVAAITR